MASRMDKIRAKMREDEKKPLFILSIACVVGCIAGVGAFGLKQMIFWLTKGISLATRWHDHVWMLAALPFLGVLIAVWWQRKVVHQDMVHSTQRIVQYLQSQNYAIPGSLTFAPILGCGVTLGFGNSAGAEGPIAFAGAAVGSNIGRWLGFDPQVLRMLIGVGAGAGIAGIFKSPIAGMLFTIEVLKMDMGAISVLALLTACLCASTTCYACTGFTMQIPFTTHEPASMNILWICALGVFCGIYSVIYNKISVRMRAYFKPRQFKWQGWVTGGAVVGGLLILFPAMYGEGYGVVGQLINGNHSEVLSEGYLNALFPGSGRFIWLLAAMLVLKALITVCSNSDGAIAGEFAPTVFAGAVAGTLFALGCNALFGTHLPPGHCALYGIAGSFAGIIHAPLMAIFLTVETTGTYQYLFPVFLCAAVSYATVVGLAPASRYVETQYDDLASLLHPHRDNPAPTSAPKDDTPGK